MTIAHIPCSTHHIDSRSLERLGVYIPRRNLAGTFINPAGIIPHSKHRAKSMIIYDIIDILLSII